LKRNGVEHQFITVAGAGHGLADGKREDVQGAHQAAVEFLKSHLK
jgi:dipeptidyl aminopeptidase/acylaminoacyl peptidase